MAIIVFFTTGGLFSRKSSSAVSAWFEAFGCSSEFIHVSGWLCVGMGFDVTIFLATIMATASC